VPVATPNGDDARGHALDGEGRDAARVGVVAQFAVLPIAPHEGQSGVRDTAAVGVPGGELVDHLVANVDESGDGGSVCVFVSNVEDAFFGEGEGDDDGEVG